MSKFTSQKPSKLSQTIAPNTVKTPIIPDQIIKTRNQGRQVKTFALKFHDIERLICLQKNIQENQNKKITSSDIIKGLLIYAERINKEDLLKCIHQSMIE